MTYRTCLIPLALAVLLVGAAPPARAQSAADLYQQALRKDRGEGNLEAAIQLYRQVLEAGDRELAARALVRIGESYERLGRAEAEAAYERVVREFADITAPAGEARVRLSALRQAEAARAAAAATCLSMRLVWEGTEPGIDVEGQPTPDGRALTFVDWTTGDLAIRDLESGAVRHVTTTGYPEYALGSTLSPDGQRVAYFWTPDPWRSQLRVSRVDGTEQRVLVDNPDEAYGYLTPHEWTPDGEHVLTSFWMQDNTARVAFVSTRDGSVRVVRDLAWRTPMRLSLSPDGRHIAFDARPERDEARHDIYLLSADGATERVLVRHAANDLHPIWTPDGSHVLFSSDRGGSIDLWAVRVADGAAAGEPFLVKRDMAQNFFWPMGFTRAGSLFYAKDTGGGSIFTAPMDATTGRFTGRTEQPAAAYVGYNTSPHVSPDGGTVVYATRHGVPSLGHAAQLVIEDLETGAVRKLAPAVRVDRKRARPRFTPDGRGVLARARNTVMGTGGLYRVDLVSGAAERLVPPVDGVNISDMAVQLTDGSVLYGLTPAGAPERARLMRRAADGTERVVLEGRIGAANRWDVSADERWLAVVDRAPEGGSRLQVYPLAGGEPRLLHHIPQDQAMLGEAGVAFSADGRWVYFGTTAAEGWTSDAEVVVWRVPADGSGPAERTGLAMRGLRHMTTAPGGLAFAAGPQVYHEVWVMDNVLEHLGRR